MKKCSCGSTEFTALYFEPVDYVVDEYGHPCDCAGTNPNFELSAAVPENYSCSHCGEIYETWDEIPDGASLNLP